MLASPAARAFRREHLAPRVAWRLAEITEAVRVAPHFAAVVHCGACRGGALPAVTFNRYDKGVLAVAYVSVPVASCTGTASSGVIGQASPPRTITGASHCPLARAFMTARASVSLPPTHPNRASTWRLARALMVAMAADEEKRRFSRLASWVSGWSAGVGAACLLAGAYGLLTPPLPEARPLPALSPLGSAAALRLAERDLEELPGRLTRKNSRTTIGEAYTFASGPPLGEGSFGVVYRAVDNKTGIERAVKRVETIGVSEKLMLKREVEAQKRMDHPNICRLVEHFETERHVWLVMELCRGEELCGRLLDSPAGLFEDDVACVLEQMARATLHSHGRSVVHRDLKPENFMYKGADRGRSSGDGTLQLVDWGAARFPSTGSTASPTTERDHIGGTLMYMSPQTLRGEAASCSDDAWSLGIIFYILLTGRFPFSSNDDRRFKEMLERGHLEAQLADHLASLQQRVSPAAHDLASRLLAAEPAERLSVAEVLRHPFLRGGEALSSVVEPQEVEALCKRYKTFLAASGAADRLRRLGLSVVARLLEEAQGSAGGLLRADRARTFRALDRGDRLSYSAFLAASFDEGDLAGDERLCRAAFDLLDADHDGALSSSDLHNRLGWTRQACDRCIADALRHPGAAVERTAATTDATLSFSDFLRLLRAPPTNSSRS